MWKRLCFLRRKNDFSPEIYLNVCSKINLWGTVFENLIMFSTEQSKTRHRPETSFSTPKKFRFQAEIHCLLFSFYKLVFYSKNYE